MTDGTKPAWVALSKFLAPWAAIVVFSAPIPTIRAIERDRSVGSLPLLPYSSMIVSSFLWLAYGALIHEPAVWRTNTCGLFMSLYYFMRFVKHAPPKSPTLPGSVQDHSNAVLLIVLGTLAIIYVMPIENPAHLIGNIAVIFCVAMFASPLAALKTVIQTKSARSIPLPLAIATCINCGLWSIVGLFDIVDFNIYFPNLLGLVCGIAQLVLKLYYGSGGTEKGVSEMDLII
ncbi:unnamed protein product [Cylindrotheca closterium]|uniref:Sugar transporter SWEET1 n=1 Tax=Cylindrotheca closterium TaxID=2856 RepID=A0AAD2CQQ9_9STRA|nr:unnamed protein product [Cylindrotheca closterium]